MWIQQSCLDRHTVLHWPLEGNLALYFPWSRLCTLYFVHWPVNSSRGVCGDSGDRMKMLTKKKKKKKLTDVHTHTHYLIIIDSWDGSPMTLKSQISVQSLGSLRELWGWGGGVRRWQPWTYFTCVCVPNFSLSPLLFSDVGTCFVLLKITHIDIHYIGRRGPGSSPLSKTKNFTKGPFLTSLHWEKVSFQRFF